MNLVAEFNRDSNWLRDNVYHNDISCCAQWQSTRSWADLFVTWYGILFVMVVLLQVLPVPNLPSSSLSHDNRMLQSLLLFRLVYVSKSDGRFFQAVSIPSIRTCTTDVSIAMVMVGCNRRNLDFEILKQKKVRARRQK
jgi:hypothetical protein